MTSCLARRGVALAVVADQQAPVLLRAQRPSSEDAEYAGAASGRLPRSNDRRCSPRPRSRSSFRLCAPGHWGAGMRRAGRWAGRGAFYCVPSMTTGSDPRRHLRVLIADEDKRRAAQLARRARGPRARGRALRRVRVGEAVELIATEDPDLAIVVVHQDDEHALALIEETRRVRLRAGDRPDPRRRRRVRRPRRRARHLRLDRVDRAAVGPGRDRGRAAPLRGDRSGSRSKVEQLESALERRSVIERAKGILMERHGIDEREAFDLLRDHARSQSRRVVDVARCGHRGARAAAQGRLSASDRASAARWPG